MHATQAKKLRTRKENIYNEVNRLQKLVDELSRNDYEKLTPAVEHLEEAYRIIARFYSV